MAKNIMENHIQNHPSLGRLIDTQKFCFRNKSFRLTKHDFTYNNIEFKKLKNSKDDKSLFQALMADHPNTTCTQLQNQIQEFANQSYSILHNFDTKTLSTIPERQLQLGRLIDIQAAADLFQYKIFIYACSINSRNPEIKNLNGVGNRPKAKIGKVTNFIFKNFLNVKSRKNIHILALESKSKKYFKFIRLQDPDEAKMKKIFMSRNKYELKFKPLLGKEKLNFADINREKIMEGEENNEDINNNEGVDEVSFISPQPLSASEPILIDLSRDQNKDINIHESILPFSHQDTSQHNIITTEGDLLPNSSQIDGDPEISILTSPSNTTPSPKFDRLLRRNPTPTNTTNSRNCRIDFLENKVHIDNEYIFTYIPSIGDGSCFYHTVRNSEILPIELSIRALRDKVEQFKEKNRSYYANKETLFTIQPKKDAQFVDTFEIQATADIFFLNIVIIKFMPNRDQQGNNKNSLQGHFTVTILQPSHMAKAKDTLYLLWSHSQSHSKCHYDLLTPLQLPDFQFLQNALIIPSSKDINTEIVQTVNDNTYRCHIRGCGRDIHKSNFRRHCVDKHFIKGDTSNITMREATLVADVFHTKLICPKCLIYFKANQGTRFRAHVENCKGSYVEDTNDMHHILQDLNPEARNQPSNNMDTVEDQTTSDSIMNQLATQIGQGDLGSGGTSENDTNNSSLSTMVSTEETIPPFMLQMLQEDPNCHPLPTTPEEITEEHGIVLMRMVDSLQATPVSWFLHPSTLKRFRSKGHELAERYLKDKSVFNLLLLLLLPKIGFARDETLLKIKPMNQRLLHYPNVNYPKERVINNTKGTCHYGTSQSSTIKKVEAYIKNGRLSAAANQIGSKTTVLSFSQETQEKVQSKFPDEAPVKLLPSKCSKYHMRSIDIDTVLKGWLSFKPDTSTVFSGWSPLLVKLLVKDPKANAFRDFMMTFTNDCIRGYQIGRNILRMSKLVVLGETKNDKSIKPRPIQVMELFMRAACKTVTKSEYYATVVKHSLLPCQFGVGSPLGCEPVLHLWNSMVSGDELPEEIRQQDFQGLGIAAVDLSNGYGALTRKRQQIVMKDHAPKLLPFWQWCYSKPTMVVWNHGNSVSDTNIGGEDRDYTEFVHKSGGMQGDPWFPFIFSLAIAAPLRDVINWNHATLPVSIRNNSVPATRLGYSSAYLDDSNHLVCQDNYQSFLETFQDKLDYYSTGLKVNMDKCKWTGLQDIRSGLQGYTIYGALIGSQEKRQQFIEEKVSKLITRLEGMKGLKIQSQWILIKFCLQHNLRHLLRMMSVKDIITNNPWKEYDQTMTDLIRSWMPALSNEPFRRAIQERIIRLPVRLGGLGIAGFSEIAQFAYDTSSEASQSFLKSMRENKTFNKEDIETQSSRCMEFYRQEVEHMMSADQLTHQEIITFCDNNSKIGNKWLTTLPTAAKYCLSDTEMMAALHVRLLDPGVPKDTQCDLCHSVITVDHWATCRNRPKEFQTHRHHKIKNIIARYLKPLGNVTVLLEPRDPNCIGGVDLKVTGEIALNNTESNMDLTISTPATGRNIKLTKETFKKLQQIPITAVKDHSSGTKATTNTNDSRNCTYQTKPTKNIVDTVEEEDKKKQELTHNLNKNKQKSNNQTKQNTKIQNQTKPNKKNNVGETTSQPISVYSSSEFEESESEPEDSDDDDDEYVEELTDNHSSCSIDDQDSLTGDVIHSNDINAAIPMTLSLSQELVTQTNPKLRYNSIPKSTTLIPEDQSAHLKLSHPKELGGNVSIDESEHDCLANSGKESPMTLSLLRELSTQDNPKSTPKSNPKLNPKSINLIPGEMRVHPELSSPRTVGEESDFEFHEEDNAFTTNAINEDVHLKGADPELHSTLNGTTGVDGDIPNTQNIVPEYPRTKLARTMLDEVLQNMEEEKIKKYSKVDYFVPLAITSGGHLGTQCLRWFKRLNNHSDLFLPPLMADIGFALIRSMATNFSVSKNASYASNYFDVH